MKPVTAKRLRLLISTISVLLLIALAAAAWFYLKTRASLPLLDGQAAVSGLGARVTVERDALGVPTIHGTNRLDVARALGFIHAQDRFFQMDMLLANSPDSSEKTPSPMTGKYVSTVSVHSLKKSWPNSPRTNTHWWKPILRA